MRETVQRKCSNIERRRRRRGGGGEAEGVSNQSSFRSQVGFPSPCFVFFGSVTRRNRI
jgi:hypothetical protein